MDNNEVKEFLPKKIKIILACLATLFVLFLSFCMAIVLAMLKQAPDTKVDSLYSNFNQTSTIYNESGAKLEEIESLEFRTIVPLSSMPENLKNAFIAIEDQRFYSHKGIDPKGILSSLLTNIKSKDIVRGGSTITQQLVKNVYLNDDKSYERKINEAYLSLRVEKNLTKNEILEAYLNRINLGQGAYGVQGAAQTYFSKDVSKLTLAESALFAGIVKSPTQYQPFLRIPKESFKGTSDQIFSEIVVSGQEMYLIFNEKSFERQKIVLAKMKELNYISPHEYKSALEEDVLAKFKPLIKKQHNMSSYSMDYIKQEAIRELSNYYNITLDEAEHKLFTGGYNLYTGIDVNLQNKVEKIYSDFISFINSETSSSKGAKMLNFSKDKYGNIIDDQNNIIYYKIGNLFDENLNLILNKDNYKFLDNGDLEIKERPLILKDDEIHIVDSYSIDENKNLITYSRGAVNISPEDYTYSGKVITIKNKFLKNNPEFLSNTMASITINKKFYDAEVVPIVQPQSSTVIVDNKTGFVKSIIGGLDINSKNSKIFNRATDSKRSPGSALQPFSVYLPALENNFNLASVTEDIPMNYDNQWWPQNIYKGYKGLLTMRTAVEYESSIVPSKILQEIGFEKSLASLSKVNIFNPNDPKNDSIVSEKENPQRNDFTLDALALGNLVRGISNIDITSAYMSLANNGNYIKPIGIVKIKDSSGITIIDNTTPKFSSSYTGDSTFLIKDVLRRNSLVGSSRGSKVNGMVTSVNVGINKFNSDLWAIGFTPYYTMGTWIGSDTPKIYLNSDTDTIIKLWNKIAQLAHEDLVSVEEYSVPKSMAKKYICQKSGKLASKNCDYAADAYMEYFSTGTEPAEYCKQHLSLKICSESNLLITKHCPEDKVELKWFFSRNPAYNPKDYNEIYPDDYLWIPQKQCNIHTENWYEEMQKKEKSSSKKKKTTTNKPKTTTTKRGN